jgi:hypothetical protein
METELCTLDGTERSSFHEIVSSYSFQKMRAVRCIFVFGIVLFVFSEVMFILYINFHLKETLLTLETLVILMLTTMMRPTDFEISTISPTVHIKSQKPIIAGIAVVSVLTMVELRSLSDTMFMIIIVMTKISSLLLAVMMMYSQLTSALVVKTALLPVSYKRRSLRSDDDCQMLDQFCMVEKLRESLDNLRAVRNRLDLTLKMQFGSMLTGLAILTLKYDKTPGNVNYLLFLLELNIACVAAVLFNVTMFNRKIRRIEDDFKVDTELLIRLGERLVDDSFLIGIVTSLLIVIAETIALSLDIKVSM